MHAIKGTYQNGQITLSEPTDWAEGTKVLVEPIQTESTRDTEEKDWPTDAESIAHWIAEFDAIPPLVMTPEEEAEWQASRKARKDYELSQWQEHHKKLDGLIP
jgi:hypothetical protein